MKSILYPFAAIAGLWLFAWFFILLIVGLGIIRQYFKRKI